MTIATAIPDPLLIAGQAFASRLLVGTGHYADLTETRAAVEASAAQIVTFAVRRSNLGQDAGQRIRDHQVAVGLGRTRDGQAHLHELEPLPADHGPEVAA